MSAPCPTCGKGRFLYLVEEEEVVRDTPLRGMLNGLRAIDAYATENTYALRALSAALRFLDAPRYGGER
jgi:hypothetical protein